MYCSVLCHIDDIEDDMDMNCSMPMPMNCNMSMGPMKMQMSFYFGFHDVTVLFEGWNINSVGALIGSFVAIFVISVLYEGLKVFRDVLQHNKGKHIAQKLIYFWRIITNKEHVSYDTMEKQSEQPVVFSWEMHVIQTILHMFQVTISYFLMLIAMTYNVWLFIAVVLGAGTGYFLFAKFRHQTRASSMQDINEHCH